MSLYKNCGRWKNIDCIFEFSVKSYVRNTKNLSCPKIVFPSVIIGVSESLSSLILSVCLLSNLMRVVFELWDAIR